MRSTFKTTVACLAITLATPAISHARQIVGYIVQPGGGTQPVYVESQGSATASSSDDGTAYGATDSQWQQAYESPTPYASPAVYQMQQQARPMSSRNQGQVQMNRLAAMNLDDSRQDGPPTPPSDMPSSSSSSGSQGSCNCNNGNQCCNNCNDCEGCNSWCKKCRCCEDPLEQRTSIYVDYLYLQAFGVDMNHGIQQNGVGGLGTVPAGNVGTAEPEFQSAFRIGAHRASSCDTGWTIAYTQYESNTDNFLPAAAGVGGTAASLVLHPGTLTAASTFDSLSANYDIDFKLADFDYDVMISCSEHSIVNFCVGARYAHLNQEFSQLGVFSGATGEELTTTSVLFDGGGLRTGFDGQWQCCKHPRWGLYGRGFVDVLFGQFDSNYRQFNVTQDFVEAQQTNWHDHRVVPMLEYETGVNWTSCGGCFRLSFGYYASHWFNVVDTAEWIQAVQHADFTNASHSISFAGLTSRVEYRF